MYRNKDSGAIRRIQERFNCCGFNTVVDRAWPFPHGRPEDGYGADQCKRMFGRDMPCSGSWRQAEQINAGMFFTVAIIILVLKVCKHFRVVWKAELLPSVVRLCSLLQTVHTLRLPAQQYLPPGTLLRVPHYQHPRRTSQQSCQRKTSDWRRRPSGCWGAVSR